jgi:hypothetical protein
MTSRSYSRLAALIFAIAAVLQLLRAVLGWPVIVETTWGTWSIPVWPNLIAAAVLGMLAWLGMVASRKDEDEGLTRPRVSRS